MQARSQAVVSALGQCCNAISDKNATALGEAVRACPPENTTALSTALAQAAADEETCPTVAAVGCWGSLPACSHCGAMRTSCGVGLLWCSLIRPVAAAVATDVAHAPPLPAGCWLCRSRWPQHLGLRRGGCNCLRCWWCAGPGEGVRALPTAQHMAGACVVSFAPTIHSCHRIRQTWISAGVCCCQASMRDAAAALSQAFSQAMAQASSNGGCQGASDLLVQAQAVATAQGNGKGRDHGCRSLKTSF